MLSRSHIRGQSLAASDQPSRLEVFSVLDPKESKSKEAISDLGQPMSPASKSEYRGQLPT